jgi:DNA-binding NarL/FixJ family response regulator
VASSADHLKVSLERLGYMVVATASTGEEAISDAENLRPDLVLMDIVLEGDVDGIEAAAKIRSDLGIPVIYLTAYTDENTLMRADCSGPSGYVFKPFSESSLIKAIDSALKDLPA